MAATFFRELGYELVDAVPQVPPVSVEPVSNDVIALQFSASCSLRALFFLFQPAHFQATFETGPETLLRGIERSRGRQD